jgi:putative transcriptional regulator
MNTLKILLEKKGFNQTWLRKKLKRDKTTISRWCNNNREISWVNSQKISKILNCHPIDIYEPRKKLILKYYQDKNFRVRKFGKKKEITVNFEHQNKIIVSLENNLFESGYKAFSNVGVHLNKIRQFEELLIYYLDKIYIGRIDIDPFSGDFLLLDQFSRRSEIIGNLKNIAKAYSLDGIQK